MTDINSTTMGGGTSTQSNSIDSKTSVLSGYSLSTSAQTIVGAINEILPKATGVGKVDSNSNGTGEIFNLYEGEYANVASGNYSHAEGWYTNASGHYSHAEGTKTTATSMASHAEGESAHATSWASHAEGYVAYATGQFSHAEGSRTTAEGDASHAEGSKTTATGTNSHAEGSYTQTFSSGEHAEGSYNKSYDSEDASVRVIHSVGIGSREKDRKNAHEIKFNGDHYVFGVGNFDGTNSTHAQTLQEVINSKQETITAGTGLEFEGNTLNVTLDTTVFKVVSALPDSPAQGDENKIHLVPAESTGANNAYTEYVWVNSAWEILGEYTSEVDLSPYLKTVDAQATYATKTELTAHTGNTSNPHNVTAAQVGLGNVDNTSDTDKPISTATQEALNLKQNATDQSLKTTDKTVVGAINEILPKATGVGKIDPNSNGGGEIFNSYEDGTANVASGNWSHAEGFRTTASGNFSHAEGIDTTAEGNGSHAEGSGSDARGMYSHAEGEETNAGGRSSHAEGTYAYAQGNFSHAEGDNTEAIGDDSHAEGYRTRTSNSAEHAEGSWNKSYDSKDTSIRVIHSVGIGSSGDDRKNAHEIKFNGDHYIYGVGGYDGTNFDSEGVQTLQEVIEEILINTRQPVIDYSAPDSAFTGTTLINSVGISAVNVWNVENYSRTDIFLLNSSGTTTDKIRYDVVRDTQYQDFQTAHEGDNMEFDEIIQLSTIVTNSFAESDLFIYHARINDEPEAKYYLVDIVMTE